MSKNIVLCSDGTGNTAIKGRGTNVFKLFEALDLTGHRFDPTLDPQVAFYDDGVGTEDFKPLKLFAGMTGYGLSRNVKQLYGQLVRVYDPGDRIFLFGFSRGAFTVRTLSGLIDRSGVLDRKKFPSKKTLDNAVSHAYNVYRECYRTKLAELVLGKMQSNHTTTFRQECCVAGQPKIKFIGVWDTVDAVGLPFHLSDVLNVTIYRFKFPDTRLSKCVEQACQALAIDEERESFRPVLWDESKNGQSGGEESGGENRISQVWFPGVHSNVGGGYPKQGISIVALDWIMTAAEKEGLRFVSEDRQFYKDHANFDDKLYNSRSGLGIFYRWKIRNVNAICEASNVTPKIHISVVERIAHGAEGYAPGNLPLSPEIEITDPGEPVAKNALRHRADSVQAALAAQNGSAPINNVNAAIGIGLVSYYLYLCACLFLLFLAAGAASIRNLSQVLEVFKSIGGLLVGVFMSNGKPYSEALANLKSNPWLTLAGLAALLMSFLLSLSADHRMETVFSEYWNGLQPKLREALKDARIVGLKKGNLLPAKTSAAPGNQS